ncbi:MAG: VOC family protein [Ignavibacteriales bacterium]|nr:VOC family protein [Ignavibacteriales bacterium]
MADISNEPGAINWRDLTVSNADEVRDFYSKVVGWKFEFVSMGEYSDYNMLSPESKIPAAGICHAQGVNADLPAQWLIYINVANIEESISFCRKLGGKLISGPKNYGGMGKYCVIQDPAGAVCALFEPKGK